MEPIKVTIGTTDITVTPVNGSLEGGELVVSSVETEIEGKNFLSLQEDIEWSEEMVKEVVRSSWMEDKEWPDTCDPEWNSPRIITPGTHVWETLKAVVQNYPITNLELDNILDYDYSASSQTADLKENNLIACIDKEGSKQILAPTHLGMKEVYEFNGLNDERGLDKLFADIDDKKVEEEEKKNKDSEQSDLQSQF